MKVLVHHPGPGVAPVGVWWLPKHRSQPQSFYLDSAQYSQGAHAVLGDHWQPGTVLTLGNWQSRIERLTESANPFSSWTVEETDNPQSLLLARPAA